MDKFKLFAREWWKQAVAVLVTAILLFSIAANNARSDRRDDAVRHQIQVEIANHGKAAADRACAGTKLLSFIIFTGNARAHELETGSYLNGREKSRIREYVRDACRFESTL